MKTLALFLIFSLLRVIVSTEVYAQEQGFSPVLSQDEISESVPFFDQNTALDEQAPLCKEQIVKNPNSDRDETCNYEVCQYHFKSFSNTVYALIPKKVTENTGVRIHLHGFSQNVDGSPYEDHYDVRINHGAPVESYDKMFEAYGMARTVCGSKDHPPQILVMPVSYYRCDDYKKSFVTQDDLGRFISEVESKLRHPIKDGQLTLSGHSGGGTHLSKILVSPDSRIGHLVIYDGLYDGSQMILDWIKLNPTLKADFVNLFTVDGIEGEPYSNANEVIQGLRAMTAPYHSHETQAAGARLKVDQIDLPEGGRVRNFYEKTNRVLNHWSLVTALWEIN